MDLKRLNHYMNKFILSNLIIQFASREEKDWNPNLKQASMHAPCPKSNHYT